MVRRAWLAAFAALWSLSLPAAADFETVSRSRCQLDRVRLTLELQHERTCGRYCTDAELHWATDPAGSVWFQLTTWSAEEGEDWAAESGPVEISCVSRRLRLTKDE